MHVSINQRRMKKLEYGTYLLIPRPYALTNPYVIVKIYKERERRSQGPTWAMMIVFQYTLNEKLSLESQDIITNHSRLRNYDSDVF